MRRDGIDMAIGNARPCRSMRPMPDAALPLRGLELFRRQLLRMMTALCRPLESGGKRDDDA